MQESWYEKLGRWEEALEAYERKQPSVADPNESIGLVLGRMRCLRALGEWGKLWNLARDAWSDVCDVPRLRKQVRGAWAWRVCVAWLACVACVSRLYV